jgi:hypothetical protein
MGRKLAMKRIAQIGTLAAFCLAAAYADPALTISGSSVVSGAPGSIVGWGYQIFNDTSFFLFVDNSAFCGPGGDPQLNSCTSPYDGVTNFGPALGIYMDFIANNLTIIAPNSTATQGFNLASQLGIGEYAISPTATPGATDAANPAAQTSNLFVTFQEYDGDPLAGGTQVSGDIEISTPVEVQVSTATPEPGAWLLMASALAMLAGWRAARSRSARATR